MAQRVRRAIFPRKKKVSASPLADVSAIFHRSVAQWHTSPHGFTLAAKVSVVFHTHGGAGSCFGVFWHAITHDRTGLLPDPAR